MFPSTSSRETLRFLFTVEIPVHCSPRDQSLSVYCYSMLASSETQGQQVGMTRYFWAKVYLKSITLTEPVSEGFVFLPADWPEKYRKPLCEVRAFEKAEERSFATFYKKLVPALILFSGFSRPENPL